MTSHHDVTHLLTERLQAQVERYQQAVAVAQRARQAYARNVSAEHDLEALQIQMTAIQEADQQLTPVKQAWTAQGQPRNTALQTQLDLLANLIRQLMADVDQLENHTRAERDRLAPELNREAKGRQMMAAYRDASQGD